MRILTLSLLLCLQQTFSFAQTPCSGGSANGFACSDVDLQSLLSVNTLGGSGDGNDIWGWTDPSNGKEYAIVGVQNGTSFVDISNPSNPTVLGFLPSHNNSSSLWRDIKVVNNYAYIVSEAGGHGIQAFDLTRLRSVASPPVTFTPDGRAGDIGNAHNIVALEETGYVIAVGAGTASGGLVFFDVNADPANPNLVGTFGSDGYTHDAICFVYRGPDKAYIGREICIGYNEDTNTIVDVTDKSNMVQISKTPYAGSSYTHQGWVTDDHRYMLVNDELDESNRGHNTRTYIFDISNLDNPSFLGFYEHPFGAIDHNLYIKGRYAYLSNYRSGLRILDIGDIANANLTEIAGFDTYQPSNSGQFNGAWSNYPYFDSGNVIVSDIEEGLFVLEPQFAHYSFRLNNAADGVIRMCPGATETFTVNINGYAGYSNNVSLSLSGLDPGLTASLSSTSVAPGGSVTITVTAANNGTPVCTGNFCVLLTGNQGNSTTEQSIALGIVVDDTLPGCSPGTACPTCDDGILNQDETDVDCGGICGPCPTCNDGMQNGDETGVDCGGPDCPECTGPCGNIPYVNCNSTISDNNSNGTNEINAYPDAFNTNGFTGPERIYTFEVAAPGGNVSINLTGLNGDLDVFLTDACDPTGNIIEFSANSGTSNESINNVNLAPGVYFLFVDGWQGATSNYNLSISCPQGTCSDSVQNEQETGVDCGGPDCPACPVYIAPKVFLQGPFNAMNMNLNLGTMIPSTEPYTALGYPHVGGGGGEVSLLGIINANNIVDWVVVELRDKNNSATVIATRSALLRQDGNVVSHLDGSSAVEFQVAADDYYIAVRHRNHLGVMTNTAVPVN